MFRGEGLPDRRHELPLIVIPHGRTGGFVRHPRCVAGPGSLLVDLPAGRKVDTGFFGSKTPADLMRFNATW